MNYGKAPRQRHLPGSESPLCATELALPFTVQRAWLESMGAAHAIIRRKERLQELQRLLILHAFDVEPQQGFGLTSTQGKEVMPETPHHQAEEQQHQHGQ
mmetsp:Transcript_39368/g.94068  ORF Transcript_39368/g.94068 Transcript_39368/m.94068 type:complete len:100 (-) Transcript_39368:327-626(-)